MKIQIKKKVAASLQPITKTTYIYIYKIQYYEEEKNALKNSLEIN